MKLFGRHSEKPFPFRDRPDTAVFTCSHVLNKERPILHVTHDEDGYWQFLCGDAHSENEARIVSLAYIYEFDKSTGALAEMDYGHSADRKDENSGWVIK